MAEIEEKDLQAFNELQSRVIETDEKQKLAQQQLQTATQLTRRAVLTVGELDKLGDETACYEAVGKAYFLKPRKQLLAGLQEQAKASTAEIKRSEEALKGLRAQMAAVESEVRELVQSSPALTRAFASAS